jgi:hypothetical protein
LDVESASPVVSAMKLSFHVGCLVRFYFMLERARFDV